MAIKVIFALDGKVQGAQIVGYDGVDKRIDVLATTLRFGGTVYDLKELELAYAPPYSSAKDPVNMVGFVGENILKGVVKPMNWNQLADLDKDAIILDVREEMERDMGMIQGSVNIPVDQLRERMHELDKSKQIVVYCAIGVRGYVASRILMQQGFEKVYNFQGGYSTYGCVFCQEEVAAGTCGGMTCDADIEVSESGDLVAVAAQPTGNVVNLNACGLQCPGPIAQVYEAMEMMETAKLS